MITFQNVTKEFPDGTKALRGISMSIPTSKLTAIIGPSGCGKTTLMRMINRLEIPTSGEVLIDDVPITHQDEIALRRSIGYVIQKIGLLPHMTIEENIGLVPELLKWDKSRISKRVDELLEMVGLDPEVFKTRYPFELSGGQQQRVGVSRALASDPDIILMDEPFSALDPISREQLQEKLRQLQVQIQKTIVFVTHDMDEALKIADYVMIMRDGMVEQMASPAELIEHQNNDFVRDFIGQDRIMRQRKFRTIPLSKLIDFYDQVWEGLVQKIQISASVDEALRLLNKYPDGRLAVLKEDQIVGYIGLHSLLQAAMAKEGGSLS